MNRSSRYEAVFSYRKSLMEEARRDYLEAQQKVDECFSRIEKNNDLIKETRSKIESQETIKSVQEINYCNQYIQSMKLKNERLRDDVRALLADSDQKYQIFLSAEIEKKIAEKLVIKDIENLKRERKKKEDKMREDIQIMRSQRRVS